MRNVLVEAGRLAAAGEPFALATVVAVERPSSARVGDRALVTADGRLAGWVGGACTEPEVVRLALESLTEGDVRRERIESRCASEGAVEVLIEPQRPALLLAVVGDAPAARTLRELAHVLGWRTSREIGGAGADAVVVASMGKGDDEETLATALDSGAGYVALVASAKRAAAVTAELRRRGIGEDALARLRSPAGLDLGPSVQEEIAVAILAELVAWRHVRPRDPTDAASLARATDPVCGMTVAVATAKERIEHDGVTYYFCSAHCRRKFVEAQVL
jgi:xanthine dehydrogenase accessory factor